MEAVEGLELSMMVIYLMVATVLVFIMHAGFMCLEAGLVRSKNAANIVMKNLMTIAVGMVVYFLIGWGLMYGTNVAGLFGSDSFALIGGSYAPDATLEMDFAFQAMFAATAATIVSGAVAERMKFGAYVAIAAGMTALIYPIVGAWTWGGGWLDALGFTDFAGSTIVHMTGGIAGLVATVFLGARIGKFGPDGKARAIPGHSMPLGMLGVLLLFFGWFGFNGGSVLALDGETIAKVLVTTALAGGAGGVAAAYFTRVRYGKFDVAMTGNGILAGLVGITAGADVVSNFGALAVGLVAGVVVALAVAFFDAIRVDDPVGAVSVHGVCGIVGTLWVGLAHTEEGLFYGGGVSLLLAQVIGVLAVALWVAVAMALLLSVIKAVIGLRVSEDEEVEGLDIHEHGMYAYPEAALGTSAYPAGPVTEPTTGVARGLPPREAKPPAMHG
ncbi:MAG TPA: ammonium transporter [Egibacteraceae bacterium]|nr:ammonium transporter [Egibacteraceae bacterium]